MAELKEFDQYEEAGVTQQPLAIKEDAEPVLTYPKKRLKNISRLEKGIVVLIILLFVTMAVLTIKVTTTITQAEEEISAINQEINLQTDQAAKLEQEKSELSRTERIKKAAEDAGLTVDDENIRNVKK